MAIKTLRVFAEYTSTGFVPMPTAGGIDYGYTLASTFPSTTPSTFQTDDPDIDVTVTAMTDFYVWIRINGTAWNPSYTRNVRVYPDSPDINSVVMNMIIATGPAGTSAYSQIVQTANRLYFNGATTDSVYDAKFAGKTLVNELHWTTAPQLATVATSGAYADLTGKPALATVATSGSYADLSSKPSGTAPLSYNSGTNSFEITQASATTNGYLSSANWTTFNNKYTLPTGGTTAQYLNGLGALTTFPTTLDSKRLIMTVRNETGTTLTKGTVVYINGVAGNTPLAAKAIASGDSTSAQTLGILDADINNNQSGNAVLVGQVTNLNTESYTEGVQLYLSGTTAGAYTSTKTLAPTHLVYVGIVTRAHQTQGVIEVKIQNGYELDELHDVQISSPANKDILYRDSATSLWKHASIASVLGYTPYNATNPNNYIALTALSASAPLSYNNTTGAFTISQANSTTNGYLSSTDWTTFNSKQSALTLGNVSEVSSNVLMFPDGGTGKTIGNLTIQVVQAGATTNGFLSSTDWTTFNNKQGNITLTTTGTSGAATFSANTLNIPQYATDLSGLVTLTTAQTVSGVKTFSGNIISQGTFIDYQNTSYIRFSNTGGSTRWGYIQHDGTNMAFTNDVSGGIFSFNKASTFSSSVTIEGNNSTIRNGNELRFNRPDNAVYTRMYDAGSLAANGFTLDNMNSEGFHFKNSGTTIMRMNSAGNVGIGTTSPITYGTRNLDVNAGSGTAAYIVARANSNGGTIELAFDTDAGYLSTKSNHPLIIRTNDAERIRITSNGNSLFGWTSNEGGRVSISSNINGFPASSGSSQPNACLRLRGGDNAVLDMGLYSTVTWIQATDKSSLGTYYTLALQPMGGNVSINYGGDAGYRLYVSGTIYATGNITANSDLTLKKNLQLIDNPIDKLMSLNGYLYQWKENDEYQYGVIAQEVEKVMSYAVSTGNDGIKGVSYNQLTPLLIEGFKLHNSEITQLKERVKYLEAKLA